MHTIAVLVDLASQLYGTATELGRMGRGHVGLLPEAYHLSAGVRMLTNPTILAAGDLVEG